jgi:hypothetical protein
MQKRRPPQKRKIKQLQLEENKTVP